MVRKREYKWRFTKSVFRRLVRNTHRNEMLEQVLSTAPRDVYAGLLAYARSRTKRDGQRWSDRWAYHAFQEIFGAKPSRQDQNVEPKPNFLIDEWAELRPKRKNGRRQ